MRSYHISISGKNFNSSSAVNLLNSLSLPGQVGINSGEQPASDGIGADKYIEISHGHLDIILKLALSIFTESKDEIDSIVVHMTYLYDTQCNIEFSQESLILMSKIGAALTISCDVDD